MPPWIKETFHIVYGILFVTCAHFAGPSFIGFDNFVCQVSSFKFKISEGINQSVESDRGVKKFLSFEKKGDQFFGIGYHFKIFRSQVATWKKG